MNKLKIGIAGLGIGMTHLKGAFTIPDVEIAAVCATSETSLDKARALLPNVTGYTSYAEMIQSAALDAIILTTPDHLHHEQTMAALRQGKHVLVEKPMAQSVAECVSMVEEAERVGKVLMVGHTTRYAPGFQKTKQLIAEGVIGELFLVESEYAHNCEEITGSGDWRTNPANGRDAFVGGGCHAADLLRYMAGNPSEVKAYANQKILKSWPCPDTTMAIYRFPDGTIGKVMASVAVRREYTLRSVFYGSKGTIIADNESPYVSVYVNEPHPAFPAAAAVAPERMKIEIPVKNESHNMTDQLADFAAVIRGKATPVSSGKSGANTLAMTCATVEAVRSDSAVRIDYPYPDE
ncbi:MAG: Gfo/Idh/MocA family oxidoreductase [Paenibacillus sp.]|nr:Gfo/Idh/MocA family oxidoreductase [Paenibacillus sp.]